MNNQIKLAITAIIICCVIALIAFVDEDESLKPANNKEELLPPSNYEGKNEAKLSWFRDMLSDNSASQSKDAEQKKSKKSEKSNVTKTTTSVIIDESKATKYINGAKIITVQDLARQTDVKISAANSYLQKLLKDGTVERIGGFSGHHLYKSVSGK